MLSKTQVEMCGGSGEHSVQETEEEAIRAQGAGRRAEGRGHNLGEHQWLMLPRYQHKGERYYFGTCVVTVCSLQEQICRQKHGRAGEITKER